MLLPRATGSVLTPVRSWEQRDPLVRPHNSPSGGSGGLQSPLATPGGCHLPWDIPALLPPPGRTCPQPNHRCPRSAGAALPTHAFPCPLQVTEMSPGSGHAGGCPSLISNPGVTSSRGVAMPIASPSHCSHYSHIKAKIGSHLEPTLPVQPIPGDSSPPPSRSVSMWAPLGTSLASHQTQLCPWMPPPVPPSWRSWTSLGNAP